jgi:outer membrane lipoprotein-sorting protein
LVVSERNGQWAADGLERALAVLRAAPVPDGPPPHLVASTVEALRSRETPPDTVRPSERRRIMFRIARYSGLAAASVFLVVAAGFFWLWNSHPGLAFGDVVENVKKAKSVTFTCTQKLTPHSPVLKQRWYLQDNKMRLELPGVQESFRANEPVLMAIIADFDKKKVLRLDFVRKLAQRWDITKDITKHWVNPIDQLRRLKDQDAERLADEKLDGRPVQVYRLKKLHIWNADQDVKEGELAKVWVDPKSGLPVRFLIESWNADHKGKTRLVFADFVWNKPLAPEMFKLEVPKGFTLDNKKRWNPGPGRRPTP